MSASRISNDIKDPQKNIASKPSPSSSDTWLFSATDHSHTATHPSHQMIGPTPTFYQHDSTTASQDVHVYQNWLDTYGHGQEQQQRQQLPAAYHQPPQMTSIVPNQYHFVPGQYNQPSATTTIAIPSSDYTDEPMTVTMSQPGISNPNSTNPNAMRGAVSDLYFYPPNIYPPSPNELTFMSTPSNPPYTPTSMTTPGSTVESPYISRRTARTNTYSTSPDLLSLPSFPHSRSHSSVSPTTSWTEDGVSGTPGSASVSGHSTSAARPTQTRSNNTTSGVKRTAKPSTSAPTSAVRGKRKRQKRNDGADGDRDSESGSDDERDGFEAAGPTVSMGGPEPVVPTRLHGACTVCKRLKMKCDFPKDENTCKRCKAGGHVCVVEGRKPRTAPNKREYLLAQIRQKDAIIESLLKQLHNPYIATPLSIASYRMATSPSDQHNRNIVAWLDRMQSSLQPPQGKGGLATFKLDSRPIPPPLHLDEDSDDGSDHNDDTKDAEGTPPDPEKISSLPDSAVPLGLIATLSLSNTKAKNNGKSKSKPEGDPVNPEDVDDDDVGVANETYFMPGPATDLGIRASLIERHSPPEILVHGLVSPEDVDKLFDIFYTRVNPFISLLDPVLHTPASTFARCPFLFTVVCAISSRYYAEKSEIYPIAMHFAKHSAANALIDGWKSVELCQAYIMMSIYAVPAKRWEEDRSWLYTGLAIRIATDLNLHQVSSVTPQNERQERETLNRTRVWMICFNLDRSTATQFGKPVTIKEDYITRNSKEWYKKSQYNLNHDVHLCGYTSLLRIVARFHDEIFSDPDSASGLNREVDFRAVTVTHDGYLTRYHEEWSKRFAEDSDPNDQSSAFRCTLLPFLVGYSRLVMYSFGFQQAFLRGIEPGDHVFFTKCLEAAKSVLKNMIDVLAPSGYMRYAPDGHFIFASFASAFLLKLLRPDFSNLLNKEQEAEVFDLIGRLIQTFSSPEIAIDDRHTPRLYARFLAGLLSRHRREAANAGRSYQQQPPPQNQIPRPPHGDYNPGSSTNTTTFSVTQPRGADTQMHDGGYTQSLYNQKEKSNTQTPTYQGGAAEYFPTTTPIELDMSADLGLDFGTTSVLSEEEMLATMQALKNPAWWQNMMMPGFSWPDQAPMMNGRGLYNPNMNNLGMQNGFGFLPTEVPL